MDQKLIDALKVLEFENVTEIPKMKEINKKWRKLSLIKHPDKGGTKEDFQELLAAYQIAGEASKKMEYDRNDIEEEIAQKMFEFMSITENKQSFTIYLEKDVTLAWEAILTKNFGKPKDQQSCGKKFTYLDPCENGGMIFITLYHTNKILLQAEKNIHSNNIHFVNAHLEDLYKQVFKIIKSKPYVSVHGVKIPTNLLRDSPVIKKARSKSLSFRCT